MEWNVVYQKAQLSNWKGTMKLAAQHFHWYSRQAHNPTHAFSLG